MHVAICMFGLLKSLQFTYPSVKEHVIDAISSAGHTYEILLHTYRYSGTYSNIRNQESPTLLNLSDWKMLNPSVMQIDEHEDFHRSFNYSKYQEMGDPWNNGFVSFENHLRALNSLYQVTLMVEELSKNKKVDAVVFLRPDVKIINELPIFLLPFYHDQPTLFVPDFQRSCRGGELNDRMAMGYLKPALVYGKKFEKALNYSKQKLLHSERFNYDYLKTQPFSVVEIPFRFHRVRSNGNVHPRDKTVYTPYAQHMKVPEPYVEGYTVHRSWLVLTMYRFLEIITLYKVYIWNHDDESNLMCHPNTHISYQDAEDMKKQYFHFKEVLTNNASSHNATLTLLQQEGDIRGGVIYHGGTHLRGPLLDGAPTTSLRFSGSFYSSGALSSTTTTATTTATTNTATLTTTTTSAHSNPPSSTSSTSSSSTSNLNRNPNPHTAWKSTLNLDDFGLGGLDGGISSGSSSSSSSGSDRRSAYTYSKYISSSSNKERAASERWHPTDSILIAGGFQENWRWLWSVRLLYLTMATLICLGLRRVGLWRIRGLTYNDCRRRLGLKPSHYNQSYNPSYSHSHFLPKSGSGSTHTSSNLNLNHPNNTSPSYGSGGGWGSWSNAHTMSSNPFSPFFPYNIGSSGPKSPKSPPGKSVYEVSKDKYNRSHENGLQARLI